MQIDSGIEAFIFIVINLAILLCILALIEINTDYRKVTNMHKDSKTISKDSK